MIAKPADWDDMWTAAGVDVHRLVEEYRGRVRSQAVEQQLLDPGRELDVPLVRVVASEDWARTVVDCVQEQGFDGEVVDGGFGVRFDSQLPPSQTESFNYALFVCRMQYVSDPYSSVTPPRQALEVLYDYQVSQTMPCVEAHGYDVEEPPSKQAWVEAYASQQKVWSPWDSPRSDDADEARREETLAACPLNPDWFYPGI